MVYDYFNNVKYVCNILNRFQKRYVEEDGEEVCAVPSTWNNTFCVVMLYSKENSGNDISVNLEELTSVLNEHCSELGRVHVELGRDDVVSGTYCTTPLSVFISYFL